MGSGGVFGIILCDPETVLVPPTIARIQENGLVQQD